MRPQNSHSVRSAKRGNRSFYYPSLAGALLLTGLAYGQQVDQFLHDDFSVDPVTMGYRLAPPSPDIKSIASLHAEGDNVDALQRLTTRLRTQLDRPASDYLTFHIDTTTDFLWPIGLRESGDDGIVFEGKFNRAAVSFEGVNWQSEAGLQSIYWGEIFGAEVLDVASPGDGVIDTQLSGHKIAQVSLTTVGQWRNQEVQLFLTPKPTFSPLSSVPKEATDSAHRNAFPEAGVRLTNEAGRARISAYAAILTPNQLAFKSADPKTDLVLDPHWLVGFSIGYPLGELTLKGELAYKGNLSPTSAGPIPAALTSPRNRVDGAVGLHQRTEHTGTWSAFLVVERWLNDSGLAVSQATRSRMALAWNDSYLDQRLRISGSAYSSLTEPVLGAVARFNYDLKNGWDTGLKITHFIAEENTAFAEMDGLTQYSVVIEYQF